MLVLWAPTHKLSYSLWFSWVFPLYILHTNILLLSTSTLQPLSSKISHQRRPMCLENKVISTQHLLPSPFSLLFDFPPKNNKEITPPFRDLAPHLGVTQHNTSHHLQHTPTSHFLRCTHASSRSFHTYIRTNRPSLATNQEKPDTRLLLDAFDAYMQCPGKACRPAQSNIKQVVRF